MGSNHSATLERAGWGPGGRWFESSLPDHKFANRTNVQMLPFPAWGRELWRVWGAACGGGWRAQGTGCCWGAGGWRRASRAAGEWPCEFGGGDQFLADVEGLEESLVESRRTVSSARR